LIVMVFLGVVSIGCSWMLLYAMRKYPGNAQLEVRVEFSDLSRHYFHAVLHAVAVASLLGYLALTLVSYIVQTAQVFDHASLGMFGCAYGVGVYPHFGGACGTDTKSDTPFGDDVVLPLSFLAIGMLCAPMAWVNLDDNVILQWIAVIGFFGLCALWCWCMASSPRFPHGADLPVSTTSVSSWWNLFGVSLFNFALAPTLPSWVNEKAPEVPAFPAIVTSLCIVIVLYTLIGIVGALAYDDWSHGNLFTKFSQSKSPLLQATVDIYPIIQNLTTIPVLSILIKYNLLQLGWTGPKASMALGFAVPWMLGLVFYKGNGFETVCEVGGLVFSSMVNFVIPGALFCMAYREHGDYARVASTDAASPSTDARSPSHRRESA